MIEISPSQIYDLIAAFFLPLTRILGVFATAPFFSHRSVPMTFRLGLSLAMTIVVFPVLPPIQPVDPASFAGLAMLLTQMLIGLAIGFTMQIVFAGVEMAGEMISMTMGLGFASFFDPQSLGRSFSLSQLLTLVSILLFICSDYHLILISEIIDSFNSLPIDQLSLGTLSISQLPNFGMTIFEIGVHLSLPIVTILLITNLAFGILTKAAPQLNLFGVGFPATLLAGYVSLLFILTYWDDQLVAYIENGLNIVQDLF
jgi:flagellar biosynthetic protein FliR